MEMKQETSGLNQAMRIAEKASHVDDDAVTIAADDAVATVAAQKIGDALEDDQPDSAMLELHKSDDDIQQATSPIGRTRQDAASTAIDRALIRQADENARATNELMSKSGFGSHIGSE